MAQSKRKILLFLFALICAVCVALFVVACDGGGTESGSESGSSSSDDGGSTGGGSGNEGGDPQGEDGGGVLDLIAENLGGDYTITVKDVSITIPDIDSHYINVSTSGDVVFTPDGAVAYVVYNNSITFDSGELYISVSENNGDYTVSAYAKGEIEYYYSHYDYTKVYSAELYCDGETVYIVYSISEDDEVTDEYVITVDCSYLFDNAEDITTDYDISGIAEQLSAVTQFTSLIESSSDLAYDVLEELFTVTETTSGGYTLTLDYTAFTQLLNNLNNCTVAEFVDAYAGTGTYASLQTLVDSLGTKTVYEAISAIFTFTAQYGLSQESTYSLINAVATAVTESTFDLESMFASGGALFSIGSMNFDEFLDTYLDADIEYISRILGYYADINAFELAYEYLNGRYYFDNANDCYELISTFYSELTDTLSVVINVASDGSISTDINLTGFSAIFSEYTGATVSASGKISITSGATIPSGASAVATKGNDIYSAIATAIGTLDSDYLIVKDGVAYYTDGTYTLEISASTSATILSVESYGNNNYYVSITDYTDAGDVYGSLSLSGTEDEEGTIKYTVYADIYAYNASGYPTLNVEISGDYMYIYTYTYNEDGYRTYYSYATYKKGELTYIRYYSYTYDANGNRTSEIYVRKDDGTTITNSYSYTYEFDDNGNRTYYCYTGSDGNSSSETSTYDDYGNLLSCVYKTTDAEGNVTNTYTEKYTYTYDVYNNMTSYKYERIDADGVVESTYTVTIENTYDDDGNLTKCVRTNGNWTYAEEYGYDDNGEIIAYSYEAALYGDVMYSWAHAYDTNGNQILNEYYDGDWGYTYEYTYDENNNLTAESYKSINDGTITYSWAYTYDSDGNTLSYVETDGDYTYTTTYEYTDGKCTKVDYLREINGVEDFTYTRVYEYNSDGNCTLDSYEDSSGVKRVYNYEYTNGKLTSETYKETDADNNVTSNWARTYEYDTNGNQTYYEYKVFDAEGNVSSLSSTTDKYDNNGNWVGFVVVNVNNGYTYTITKVYDINGNLTDYSYVVTDADDEIYSSEKQTYTYNAKEQLTSKVYEYIENKVTTTITYAYTYSNNVLSAYTVDYVSGTTTAKYVITISSKGYKASETYTDNLGNSYTNTWNDDYYLLTSTYTTDAGTEDEYNETYTYTYNDDGNYLTREYENNNEEWYSYTYTYYDSGIRKSEDYVSSDTSSHSFTYNEDGQCLSSSYVMSNGYTYSYTYTYDEDGNCLTEAYENSDNVSYSYEYTYNDYGWVATEKYTDSAGSSTATYTYKILDEDYWDYYVEVTITYDNDETIETYTTWMSKY